MNSNLQSREEIERKKKTRLCKLWQRGNQSVAKTLKEDSELLMLGRFARTVFQEKMKHPGKERGRLPLFKAKCP